MRAEGRWNAVVRAWPVWCSVVIGLVSWSSWGHCVFAFAVVVPWAAAKTRKQAVLAAFGYYMAGMRDLALIVQPFFAMSKGTGLLAGLVALVFWAAILALILALCWRRDLHERAWGVLVALFILAIPPLGWLSVIHPLNSAGWLFPGTSLMGVALTVILMLVLAQNSVRSSIRLSVTTCVLLLLSACLNLSYQDPLPPNEWVAIDTQLGTLKPDTQSAWLRVETINQASINVPRNGVGIFPESALGIWSPRTQYWLNQQRDQVTVIGATRKHVDGGLRLLNSVGILRAGHDPIWIDARVPMPVGMWIPGQNDGYIATLKTNPDTVNINGERAVFSICYEDLLAWTNMTAVFQKPTVLVSLSSLWFANGLSLNDNERRTAHGWARLISAKYIRAVNW